MNAEEMTAYTGVPASMINTPTIRFIYGKIASNPNAFEELSSEDIVKAAFGIEATNPSSVDISEAIVNTISNDDQIKLRQSISDKNTYGELWNFCTDRMFMISLCKEPVGNGGHDLSLVLISKYNAGELDSETLVRTLVNFGSTGVRFQTARLHRRIEYRQSSVEMLQKIHDDAVAKLEDKVLQPIIRKGERVVFSAYDETVRVTRDNVGVIEFTNADFKEVYIDGIYVANTDVHRGDFMAYEQLHELMDKFDHPVEDKQEPEQTTPQVPETQPEPETQPLEEPTEPKVESAPEPQPEIPAEETVLTEVEPENKENEKMKLNVIFDDEFDSAYKGVLASVEGAFRMIFDENSCESDAVLSDKLVNSTEIDNIFVELVETKQAEQSLVYKIGLKPSVKEEIKEELAKVDLSDPNIQTGLLRGLFGVVDPAITHVHKFLRNHLTSENNPGFALTGTFPTETVIVYDTVTVAIVKFKDSRFFRIFAANTNHGLSEHGYIATHNISGRWYKLGRDIQDISYRGERRRF